MTVITTSTASTATAYSNQRKIDRTSNGVLWAIYWDGAQYGRAAYSTDNGATWAVDTGSWLDQTSGSYTPNASFFIDQDDFAHVAFKDRTNGYVYYRRGTPNAGRTAWTWSAATNVFGGASYFDYPDVVAHREGTGWTAHVVASRDSSSQDRMYYAPVTVTSGGVVSVGTLFFSGAYGHTVHKYPSIDFNHTGDGKTVAGGTPHLYVAWSAGAVGTGKGIRFRKATYSGGSWTWGTEREIDGQYAAFSDGWTLNCLFDGTSVMIAGCVGTSNTASAGYLKVYERDAADTSTFMHYSEQVMFPAGGSVTYDIGRNLYFFGGTAENGQTYELGYRKWDRATETMDPATTLFSGVPARSRHYVSAKRGHSNNRIEFIYTNGTTSPYSVTYDSISLNEPPLVAITTAEDTQFDPRLPFTVDWSYFDTEGSTQLQSQASWRVAGGTWADMPAQAGAATSYTFPANTITDESDVEVRVRAHDGSVWGDWDTVALRSDSWTYEPEIVGTASTDTIDTTGWGAGLYEVQVATSDAAGYGPYGSDMVEASDSNVAVYLNGQWQTANRYVYYGGQWVRSNPVTA